MTHLAWKDEFSVGVAVMDDDHRALLEIIGRLYQALSSGAERQAPLKICDELIAHTLVHFEHEERWFDNLQYPRSVHHRRMHEKLKQRIVDFRTQLCAEPPPALEQFELFTDWLAHHISGEDRSYGAWLNSQGIH
jgi:hemerythrin